ncbi:hypothetical protein BCV72DRAFT_62504 [Rhizopus microsporus var. microsporus]|uniref:Conserved oligomeric Golgi complex subunit 4 N-terminal domain-containing protein n=1 Tax=Rhizopus microsporus var. microsporus TaxID=86635 RepID=A0A1X0QQG3_RHIZD|nr:hypothetical protein BCV72DRAFT_62504 [Rhizopus microsporus var. microsporus]
MPTATLSNQSLMQTNILDKEFDSLINIDEIRESLRQLDEEENRIDAFLDDILKQESILDTSLNSLKAIKPQLDTLKVKAATFTDTVSQTAHLAEVISDKVRQLDKEQTRAKLAIKYVEDVQELKFCISSLNEAMQKKEYDRAALLLQRASKIDSSILKGSLAEFTVVSHYFYLQVFAYILSSLHQSTQIIQKKH